MSLATNLRIYRKRAGITQIQLAQELGVSIATLRRWEAGETTPTGTRIMEIAERLGIAPEDIVSRENSETKSKAATANNGMLVFDNGETRVELPPTEKGYELFNKLVENLIKNENKK